MSDRLDVVVCGSCVLDIIVRPVDLDKPIVGGKLYATDPPTPAPGGITSNAGIALARLGRRVGVASYVGNDRWGGVVRDTLSEQGVETTHLIVHPDAPTSTTVVLVDGGGERSFLHAQGAPRRLDAHYFDRHAELWRSTSWMLLGYYPLLPNLIDDLPGVLERIRASGCRTALDAAGDGGGMSPLDRALPHLDLYVPSLAEAKHQTGEHDPQRIIHAYRGFGCTGLLGVKLGGADGVLLSERADDFTHVPSASPPGPVVDTTGAGDCFLAGLIAGLCEGLPIEDAGTLGCRTAAQCVTALGGWAGVVRTTQL